MKRLFSWFVVVMMTIVVLQEQQEVDGKGKQYEVTDDVPLIANRVGPFANPSEIYSYYSLPYCAPDDLVHQSHDLGELLSGDRKVRSKYDINFRVDVQWRKLCRKVLTEEEVKTFETAIDEEYYFEMFLDNLPIWGYVGDSDKEAELLLSGFATPEPHKYVYTHFLFSIAYNGPHVIEVNVTASPLFRFDVTKALESFHGEKTSSGNPINIVPIPEETGSLFNAANKARADSGIENTDDAPDKASSSSDPREISFSYSVKWIETSIPYDHRMERYQRMHFLPASFQIHWLSIVNAFVLVILLTIFLAVILMRILKNDFSRYMQADEEGMMMEEEESGWKLLHGDVFRIPNNKMLFTAMLGAGSQLFFMVLGVLLVAIVSGFYPQRRGSIPTAIVVFYALTACIGGYVSGRYYRQFGGTNWVWNTILCACLFPGPLFAVFVFVNTVAFSHGSVAALPIGTIFVILALYVLVTFPLTVVGGIVGRNSATDFEAPCRTTKAPRQIPPVPWSRSAIAQYFVAGLLPFSSIYIEIHYIFASVWGHRVYTLFGVLFLAFVLLLIVTSFITIALTYFQLVIEDHQWWWRSFISGGFTGVFLYAYSIFYFFERSQMNGFLQAAYFFGYMIVVSYGFFLLLGTVGFFSSLLFVKRIYRTIKAN